MALALLALLAQFWVGQISTAHLGQMLTQSGLLGDICTVAGSAAAQPRAPSDHSAVDAALACPTCTLAAASTVTPKSPAQLPALAPASAHQFSYLPAPARALRHASLYPPAHAPPLA